MISVYAPPASLSVYMTASIACSNSMSLSGFAAVLSMCSLSLTAKSLQIRCRQKITHLNQCAGATRVSENSSTPIGPNDRLAPRRCRPSNWHRGGGPRSQYQLIARLRAFCAIAYRGTPDTAVLGRAVSAAPKLSASPAARGLHCFHVTNHVTPSSGDSYVSRDPLGGALVCVT